MQQGKYFNLVWPSPRSICFLLKYNVNNPSHHAYGSHAVDCYWNFLQIKQGSGIYLLIDQSRLIFKYS
jgi:hypothetical protein